MKNYILVFALIFTTISFAQTITSKKEEANVEQYALLQKVNKYYPDITLNKTVTNFYADGNIIDTHQEFDLTTSKFSSYKIGLEPDNKKLLFEYVSDETGKVYGDVTIFKGNALRTTFNEKNNEISVSLNGKPVYLKKIKQN
ncbi:MULTISPECIES: hypothetical protein [Flavobacterium]|jgi:hypothetical protein|uniref:DUF3471 domain-containing protein n=2 Tax=Flavobacterium TaxID=237 RepID=A0A1S1J3R6_9FLAO|nr:MULTISPECIES: hypothetical protein [Flavobacterium]MCC9020020.1 hypothetical protein [Flavobacterium sp. F-126]MDL2144506.1 hypothetical protein [Flavobacterium tructae]OHT44119.1 hypothetical protein BHE19_14415 [Flavobacterium tructae]OXB20242.1 hypothetical protein B0A71_07590 [Flavobacterium tructae]OXB22981.1 hypothetical protein B0A80_13400 [Flavobacterium tructae]